MTTGLDNSFTQKLLVNFDYQTKQVWSNNKLNVVHIETRNSEIAFSCKLYFKNPLFTTLKKKCSLKD